MNCMFYESKFNGDISKWNTSKVINTYNMFGDSVFNGDISNWDFSSLVHKLDKIGIEIKEKEWDTIKVYREIIKCSVLLTYIEQEYIKCSTCNKTFDVSIKKEWKKKIKNAHIVHVNGTIMLFI